MRLPCARGGQVPYQMKLDPNIKTLFMWLGQWFFCVSLAVAALVIWDWVKVWLRS